MTLAILIIVAVVLVLGVGLLIFTMMRRSQDIVPDVADRRAADGDQVVSVDDDGQAITASQEPDDAPRDGAAFEDVLEDELKDLGH